MKNSLVKRILHLLFCCHLFLPIEAKGQIIPDRSLPNNSQVTFDNKIFTIEGGTVKDNALFHSFQEFSLPSNLEAYFNNSSHISNIFSKVSGTSISQIDGLIRANHNTNLFLLNPNGFLFGKNAKINVDGSFIVSTADKIKFASGAEFGNNNFDLTVPIKINFPFGLYFEGNSPATIKVEGFGHNLIGQNFQPVSRLPVASKLQMTSGKNLFLLGGNLDLTGANLINESGKIEIASIRKGIVTLFQSKPFWNLNYEQVQEFGNIRLSSRSWIDTSSSLVNFLPSGSINLQGEKISLQDGSVILNQNLSSLPSGQININALESLEISGTDPIAKIAGSLFSEAFNLGQGADIIINAPELKVFEGGLILTVSYAQGSAGNISLNAPRNLKILGFSPRSELTLSTITSTSFGSGTTGTIEIEAGNLFIENGGTLLSTNFGQGEAGDLTIKSPGLIKVSGFQPDILANSAIGSLATSSGNAGNLNINTSNLLIEKGAKVGSATLASGQAGNLNLNASSSIIIDGQFSAPQTFTSILSSANTVNDLVLSAFNFPNPSGLTGESGNIFLTTDKLLINEFAEVTVKNIGTGNAGSIQIEAQSITLNNNGNLTATTNSGQGGNLQVNGELIQLQNQSIISTTARQNGDGGNVSIKAKNLTLLSNSSITANAFEGTGGNINIDTKGFFVSPDSSITATSELGVDGDVNVNFDSSLLDSIVSSSSFEIIDTDSLIANSCLQEKRAQGLLTLTGQGALRPSPNNYLSIKPLMSAPKPIVNSSTSSPTPVSFSERIAQRRWRKLGDPVVEGRILQKTEKGWRLVAASNPSLQTVDDLICN